MGSHPPFQIGSKPLHRQPSVWLQTAFSVVAAIVLAVFLNFFVFQSYYVDGESMSPTLHTQDRLIISKVERSLANAENTPYVPVRGQVLVINGKVSPSTESSAPHLIKRVIGLPGDRIIIVNGKVLIYNDSNPSGFDVDEALGLKLEPTYSATPINAVVPAGHVFVMGDNRAEGGSYDSRSFGMVDTTLIEGRLWARVLPLSSGRVF